MPAYGCHYLVRVRRGLAWECLLQGSERCKAATSRVKLKDDAGNFHFAFLECFQKSVNNRGIKLGAPSF
jgi:hypothetical protein